MKNINKFYLFFLMSFLNLTYKLNSADKDDTVILQFSYTGKTLVDFFKTAPTRKEITDLLEEFDATSKKVFVTESDRFSGFTVSIIYMRRSSKNPDKVPTEFRNSIGANDARTNDFYRSIGSNRKAAIQSFMNDLAKIRRDIESLKK